MMEVTSRESEGRGASGRGNENREVTKGKMNGLFESQGETKRGGTALLDGKRGEFQGNNAVC